MALAVIAAASWWECAGSRNRTPPILDSAGRVAAGSVATLEAMSIGGVPQWILVRGRDRKNPVLLFVHGGPGMPAMYLAHAWQRPLEDDFVVVQWDRRGCGKSWRVESPLGFVTVRRTLDDLIELTDVLRAQFGQERIYLLGHSWGSYLGLLAVREHPERFVAFIGTGQMAGSEAEVVEARRAALPQTAPRSGDRDLASRLQRANTAPSEDDLFTHGGELAGATGIWPLLAAGLRAPEYEYRDILALKRSADRVNREMVNDVSPRPLEGDIDPVQVPVYFFLGRHDLITPPALAAALLSRLHAPAKGLEWFEASAHFPFFEEPESFRRALSRVVAATLPGVPQDGRRADGASCPCLGPAAPAAQGLIFGLGGARRPYAPGRIVGLSLAAARQLGMVHRGRARVRVERTRE